MTLAKAKAGVMQHLQYRCHSWQLSYDNRKLFIVEATGRNFTIKFETFDFEVEKRNTFFLSFFSHRDRNLMKAGYGYGLGEPRWVG
jgi:hypothetical protein